MFLHHNMNFFMKIAIFENVSWGHLKSKIFKNNIRKWNLSMPFKVFQELPMSRIIYKKIEGWSGKFKKNDFLPGLYYIEDNVPVKQAETLQTFKWKFKGWIKENVPE